MAVRGGGDRSAERVLAFALPNRGRAVEADLKVGLSSRPYCRWRWGRVGIDATCGLDRTISV